MFGGRIRFNAVPTKTSHTKIAAQLIKNTTEMGLLTTKVRDVSYEPEKKEGPGEPHEND